MSPAKELLEEPLPGCWAALCSIRRNNPVPNSAPTSSRSNMPIGTRMDYRCRGKDGRASVGREGSPKHLIYVNKIVR